MNVCRGVAAAVRLLPQYPLHADSGISEIAVTSGPLGYRRSVSNSPRALFGVANDESFPDTQPFGVGTFLLDAWETCTERICHGIDAPRLALIDTNRPECHFARSKVQGFLALD